MTEEIISGADQLKLAHARMTPEEIAAHALEMAAELERMHQAFDRAAQVLNTATDTIAKYFARVRSQQEAFRLLDTLTRQSRKRAAREMLHELAAIPDVEETTLVMIKTAWSQEIFNPFPERQA